MDAIYHVKADELDQDFLDALKAMFKDKEIEIAVSERDETAYLLRSPANREHLLRAVADVASLKNIVAPEQEQFQ
jgi:antitoxin YefM